MSQHFTRRLEASINYQLYNLWTAVPFPGELFFFLIVKIYSSLVMLNLIILHFSNHLCFKEPNPEDPLNKEAAEVLQTNRRLFETNVQKSMRGGYIGSVS